MASLHFLLLATVLATSTSAFHIPPQQPRPITPSPFIPKTFPESFRHKREFDCNASVNKLPGNGWTAGVRANLPVGENSQISPYVNGHFGGQGHDTGEIGATGHFALGNGGHIDTHIEHGLGAGAGFGAGATLSIPFGK